MRFFIALNLNEEIKKELEEIIDRIKKENLIAGNFVNPENMHLTLKFLGEVAENKIDWVKGKLSDIKMKKFECTLGKLGVFPNENFIRVLWAELISKENKFKELFEGIESSLEEEFAKEKREFSSHITLVRVKNIEDKQKFLDKLKETKIKEFGFVSDSFSLMASELQPEGPIYKELAKFNLI